MSSCQLQRRKPPLPPFMPLPLQPVGKRAGAKGRGFDDRAAEQRITAHLSGAKRRSQKPAMACQRTAQAPVHSLAALSRAAAANNLQPCSPGRLLVGPAGLAHLYFLLALVSLEARSFSRSRLPSSSFSLLEAGGRGTTHREGSSRALVRHHVCYTCATARRASVQFGCATLGGKGADERSAAKRQLCAAGEGGAGQTAGAGRRALRTSTSAQAATPVEERRVLQVAKQQCAHCCGRRRHGSGLHKMSAQGACE